jgi:hypothetical protein
VRPKITPSARSESGLVFNAEHLDVSAKSGGDLMEKWRKSCAVRAGFALLRRVGGKRETIAALSGIID